MHLDNQLVKEFHVKVKAKVTPRLLTGMRPTGPLHLGHYVGALKQWIPLQRSHQCFFLIADVQAFTTHADNPALVKRAVRDMVFDWVSVGINPKTPNVNFVLQSAIPELFEMTSYFKMLTPFGWMTGNPTIKAELKHQKNPTVGFMGYLVDQAADVLFVSRELAEVKQSILVPVGQDQVKILRTTNRIAKRFNKKYGDTFNLCEPLVGKVGSLVGTDGNEKMSKSLGNVIQLSDTKEDVAKKVMSMFTDPTRTSAKSPGKVEGNPVFQYHDAFNPNKAEVAELKRRYREGTVGDVEVKQKLIVALERFLKPIRLRRKQAKATINPNEVLAAGTSNARLLAKERLAVMKKRMGLLKLSK